MPANASMRQSLSTLRVRYLRVGAGLTVWRGGAACRPGLMVLDTNQQWGIEGGQRPKARQEKSTVPSPASESLMSVVVDLPCPCIMRVTAAFGFRLSIEDTDELLMAAEYRPLVPLASPSKRSPPPHLWRPSADMPPLAPFHA